MNKKMKNSMISFILCFVIGFGLTACGSSYVSDSFNSELKTESSIIGAGNYIEAPAMDAIYEESVIEDVEVQCSVLNTLATVIHV